MKNINGRLNRIADQLKPPTPPGQALIMADGSFGLYRNGRLVSDLGATINKIYSTSLPPAPEKPGQLAAEQLHELITRVWREGNESN